MPDPITSRPSASRGIWTAAAGGGNRPPDDAPCDARAMLVFLAQEWGGLTTGELGRRLRRDPSTVSRFTVTYAAQRNSIREAQVRRVLDPKSPE